MISLMQCRAAALEQTLEGLLRSGVPLVSWTQNGYAAAGFTDDLGLYFCVPLLARLLGITSAAATDVFFIGLAGIAMASALVACFRMFCDATSRFTACLALSALALITLRVGDVHIVSSCLILGMSPWVVHLARKADTRHLALFAPLLGVVTVVGNLLRSQAGTGLVVFALALLAASPAIHRGIRVRFVAVVIAAAVLTSAAFGLVIAQRDAFLEREGSHSEDAVVGHPLWHTVYIGLGYIPNDYGIEYSDEVAMQKVEETRPGTAYVSGTYEAILRDEVLHIVAEDPLYVCEVLWAKLLVILGYFLRYANLGLVAAAWRPKPPHEDIAFAAALAFLALPGLVAVPRTGYLLGFIALSVVFALVSIDWALRKGDGPRPLPSRLMQRAIKPTPPQS